MGSGVKEQLWALLEFMEEGDADETERIFCTIAVHKAFDQVYSTGMEQSTCYMEWESKERCCICLTSGSVRTMQYRRGGDTLEIESNLLRMA